MQTLTFAFLLALGAMVAVRWWLATRQLAALGRHRDEVPAPFAATISAADHARAADYTAARLRLARLELVWDALLLLAVTLGGGLAALDAWLARFGWPPLWHGVATLAGLALAMAAAALPFDLYSTFRIEARFGFNRTTPRLYLADLARSLALAVALGVPLLALLLALMTAAGRAWWLYAWAAWVAFGLAVSFLWPRFIAPLFNRFRALEQGALRDAIEHVMQRCGFSSEGVFVMDGSRRSSHGNAYFTDSANPSASYFSTRCSRGSRRAKSKRCSRTNSATSS